MGQSTSSAGARGSGASSEPAKRPLPEDGCEEFEVKGVKIAGSAVLGLPKLVQARFELESMVLLAGDTRQVLRTFPYFTIMSWGSTDGAFAFRVFDDLNRATKGPRSDQSSPEGASMQTKGEARDKADGTGSASGDAAGESGPTDSPTASDRKPTAAAAEPSAGSTSGSGSAPDAMASTASTLIILDTPNARDIEAGIMRAVLALMRDMQQVGLTEAEMAAVRAALEEDGDEALDRLRTLAVSRRFDARQGAEILQDIGRLSPFDKVEAAVLLHGALMDGSSFKLLLEQFEDEDERDNVCTRLGIKLADVV